MNALEEKIWESCQQVLTRQGWHTFRDIAVRELPRESPAPFNAYINLADFQITLEVVPHFTELIQKVQRKHALPETAATLTDDCIHFIVTHEHGHYKYCPINKENTEQIVGGVYDYVEGKELRRARIEQICFRMQNLFSDTILNTVNAHQDTEPERYRRGLATAYLIAGEHRRQLAQGIIQRWKEKRMDKGMALFLESQRLLCTIPSQYGETMMSYRPRFFPGFSRYRRGLIRIFAEDDNVTDVLLAQQASPRDIQGLTAKLQKPEHWRRWAYEYAKVMYPYLNPKHQYAAFGDSQNNPQDNSQARRADDSAASESKQCKPEEQTPQQQHDDSLASTFRKLLKKCFPPRTSPYLSQLPELDKAYRQRARDISISVKGRAAESETTPLMLSREEVSPRAFSSGEMDWAGTRLVKREQGTSLSLSRKDVPMHLDMPQRAIPSSAPDLCFIVDSSTSMDFEPWKDNGRGEYHYAVLGVYGILNYLERHNLAHLLRYSCINFSTHTKSSGWHPYPDILQVKRVLFDYTSGGTVLEPEALRQIHATRGDNYALLMLSDTEFNLRENAEEVLRELHAMGTSGAYPYLFQIGGQSAFSQAFKELGYGVTRVHSTEDFVDLGILFTKELYRECTS